MNTPVSLIDVFKVGEKKYGSKRLQFGCLVMLLVLLMLLELWKVIFQTATQVILLTLEPFDPFDVLVHIQIGSGG